jgi:hypothetical protein
VKKEVVLFRKDIQPGVSEILSERIKSNGAVKSVKVRFYDGSEGSFHVNPYVLHKGSLQENVVSYPDGGEKYMSGNDDDFNFDVSIPIEIDDELKVYVNNTSSFVYTLVCDIGVVYYEKEGK